MNPESVFILCVCMWVCMSECVHLVQNSVIYSTVVSLLACFLQSAEMQQINLVQAASLPPHITILFSCSAH